MSDETTTHEKGALTAKGVDGFRRNFEADPSKQLMQNAVTQHDVHDVALNRSIVTQAAHTFSTVLDDWAVTNQARTGLLDVRRPELVSSRS